MDMKDTARATFSFVEKIIMQSFGLLYLFSFIQFQLF